MKKSILLLIAVCAGFTLIQAKPIRLPNECKKLLDKNFRGWKFGKILKGVTDYHKREKHPFEPYLIQGDWNGDGKIDYAVLIENQNENKTIAFIRLRKKYKHYNLAGGDYIQVFNKGEKDYSYDTHKNFVYKNDSIFVGLGECCGTSYIWRKGKFVGVVTSD